MQHFGDLEPLGRQDIFTRASAQGRYSASRSRWRFAVGRMEIGFHRERESLAAESRPVHARITPDQLPAPQAPARGFGERFMTLLGVATALVLITGATGLFWGMRSGAAIGRGEVSTAIRDVTPDVPDAAAAGKAPFVIPARKTARDAPALRAVIEQARPGPAAAPAATLAAPIAEAGIPGEQVLRSGNFAAIPQVASAISAAMVNGDAQNWSAGPYHGVVVMGEADARKCREGTVLLRDGSDQGRTQPIRRCAS